MAARLVILAYALGWIQIDGDPHENNLIVASYYVRCVYLNQVLLFIFPLYLERKLATYYLLDYEKLRRSWISLLLTSCMIIAALVITYLFQFQSMPFQCTVGVVSLALIGNILFYLLYKENVSTLEYINRDRSTFHHYTLSMRFQLDENVRAMKLIHDGVIILFIINIVTALAFILANSDYVRNIWDGQLSMDLDCVFNIMVALNGIILPIGIMLSQDTYMRIVKTTKFAVLVGMFLFWYNPPKEEQPENETATYFIGLQMQWNKTKEFEALAKKKRRMSRFRNESVESR